MKEVRIRSYSGPYFSALWLNTERCSVSLGIQSECGKIRSRITPNTDTFYAVYLAVFGVCVSNEVINPFSFSCLFFIFAMIRVEFRTLLNISDGSFYTIFGKSPIIHVCQDPKLASDDFRVNPFMLNVEKWPNMI